MKTKNPFFDAILDFCLGNPELFKVVMAVIAIGTVVCTMILISQNRVFEKTAKGFMRAVEATKRNTERRIAEEERLQQEVGNREKKNIFYRMDESLYHAGIKAKIPWMTVEILILIVGMVMLLALFLFSKKTGSFVVGVTAAAMVLIAVLACLKIMCHVRNRKIEDGLLQFANLIENYSRTSDDIVGIFGKVYRYLDEPLRSGVAECYSEAITTGDFSKACTRLSKVMGNPQLTNLLSNIEICARHEANYEAVTKSNKRIIRERLAEEEIRREMANSARLQVLILVIIGAIIVMILNRMTNGTLFQSLLYTKQGNAIFAGIIGFVMYSAYKLFTMGHE